MSKLLSLSSEWRNAAATLEKYSPDVAKALRECADQLDEALPTEVNIDMARRLTGKSRSTLRRYAQQVEGLAHQTKTGRWVFDTRVLGSLVVEQGKRLQGVGMRGKGRV
jgi:hypothetical protein